MTPQEAKTHEDICALDRDNWNVRGFDLFVDERSVYITDGFSAGTIEIPRAVFDKIVAIYTGNVI